MLRRSSRRRVGVYRRVTGGGGGGTAPDGAILLQNDDWIGTESGDAIGTGPRTPVAPTVDAGQTFSFPANLPPFTTIGTVLSSGDPPDGFTISSTGIAITSVGVLSRTGPVSEGAATRNVSVTLAAYTSPPESVGFTVGPRRYTPEFGDNIVYNATAWTTGVSVAQYARRANAGKLYEAQAAGTTGATAPTHTSGVASDGAVQWLFLCTIDYTSVNSWAATLPTNLTEPRACLIWNTGEVVDSRGEGFEIVGFNAIFGSSTNTVTIKAKEEDAWYNNPARVYRYDATQGVAFRCTNGTSGFRPNFNWLRIKGLQFRQESTNKWTYLCSGGAQQSNITESCIFETTSSLGGLLSGVIRNCHFVMDSNATNGQLVQLEYATTFIGNTVVRPTNRTAAGLAIATNNGTHTLTNNIICGFTTATTGSITGTNNATSTSGLAPATNGVTIVPANEFVQPSSAGGGLDLRLKAGALCIGAAAVAPTNSVPTDAYGRTRGTAWDIGAHEYA